MKKTFIVLLSLLLVFGATAFALTAAAEGPIPKITASGEYVYSDTGDTITWSLDHGVLTVGSRVRSAVQMCRGISTVLIF